MPKIKRKVSDLFRVRQQGKKPQKLSFMEAFGDVGAMPPCSSSETGATSKEVFPLVTSSGGKRSYADKRIQLTERWRVLEKRLCSIGINLYKPMSDKCVCCFSEVEEIIRCLDCGVSALYCEDCWTAAHSHIWHHRPDIWKQNMFIKMERKQIFTLERAGHDCTTLYAKTLTLIDCKGYQHKVSVMFCSCEGEAETLYRYLLWPCSPCNPKVAVSVELMEWLRVLSLEKHISTEGFCNAIAQRFDLIPGNKSYVKDLSKILLNKSLESYRHHIYQLSHTLPSKFGAVDDGTNCPACKGDPTCEDTYCLDGNFGLVRRLAAGTKKTEPHHNKKLFLQDDETSTFIDNYCDKDKHTQNCSDFQAGDKVRSKSKNKKLDVKGIFGCCCRHEFPKLFMDLKHGERLGYPVFLLKKLLEQNSNTNVKVFYDIACRLEDHLRARVESSEILKRVTFAVPVFHGYGHNMACQMKYNPRKKVGFGLTEGETVERLWSYLRNFSKITKEMLPEHRTDLLTDGLIHYGAKLKAKFGSSMVQKLAKATATNANSSAQYQELLSLYPADFNINEHMLACSAQSIVQDVKLSKTEEHAIKLWSLNNERSRLAVMEGESNCDSKKIVDATGSIARLEKQIRMIEKKENLPVGLTLTNPFVEQQLNAATKKKKSTILAKLNKQNMERKFLVSLVKKYPSGQAVAQRILGNVKRVTSIIKKLLVQYNEMKELPSSGYPTELRFTDILNDESSKSHVQVESMSSLNQTTVQAYCLLQRSSEEIEIVKKDMASVLKFYEQQLAIIHSLCLNNTEIEHYLRCQYRRLQLEHERLNMEFCSYIGRVPGHSLNIQEATEEDDEEGQVQEDIDELLELLNDEESSDEE